MNLSSSRGLESCIHLGPSVIDDWTLARSGLLPVSFLIKCGASDQLVEFGRSLEFDSIFISYSTADQEFAEHLHADLKSKGVNCWFAPHNVRGGIKLHDQINDAIHGYDRLLLILSEHSMKSEWVKTEIAQARQKEMREKRQMLFPVSLAPFSKIREWKFFDADTGKDSAREIREYFIPDFSNWRNGSYQTGLQRLLGDLKRTGTRIVPRL